MVFDVKGFACYNFRNGLEYEECMVCMKTGPSARLEINPKRQGCSKNNYCKTVKNYARYKNFSG